MKLLTKELRKKLPPLYSTENVPENEKIVVVKFFSPWSNYTWYAVEFDGKDKFFGLVVGQETEWGYFLLSEMKNAKRGRLPLVERDKFWRPRKIGDIK